MRYFFINNYFIINSFLFLFSVTLLIFFIINIKKYYKLYRLVINVVYFTSFLVFILTFLLFFYVFDSYFLLNVKNHHSFYWLFNLDVSFFQSIWFLEFFIDKLSILFLVLLNFLSFILLLLYTFSYKINKTKSLKKRKNFLIFSLFIFLLQLILFIFFTTADLFVFYVVFECSMLPLYFLINFFGKRTQRVRAAFYLFYYTLVTSIPFLLGILFLISLTGSSNFFVLYLVNIPFEYQVILWLAFFLPFATKLPIIPFHLWLPEAHVEASTEGSVLLAGLMLKLGAFGLFKILIPIFWKANLYVTSFVWTIAVVSMLYSSMSIFRQVDLKKIIAYSSIAHMNYVLACVFSYTTEGYIGGILLLFVHGIISSGLFICVGFLYNRFHTRNIHYYSGLNNIMPYFSFYFFLLILGNSSFPGTAAFIAELWMVIGIVQSSFFLGFWCIITSLLTTFFSFLTFVRMVFGVNSHFFSFVKKKKTFLVLDKRGVLFFKKKTDLFKSIKHFFSLENCSDEEVNQSLKNKKFTVLSLKIKNSFWFLNLDLTKNESLILGVFVFFMIFLGIFPNNYLWFLLF